MNRPPIKILYYAAALCAAGLAISAAALEPSAVERWSWSKSNVGLQRVRATGRMATNDQLPKNIIVKDHRVTVQLAGGQTWQTPVEWRVVTARWADVTASGKPWLLLSLWKAGDFGSSKPFWIDQNDQSVRQHLFVFEVTADQARPIWQSSNLDQPNCDLRAVDVDEDGAAELVVLEGQYRSDQSCQPKNLAVWRWREWGFYLDWRSTDTRYGRLWVEQGLSSPIIGVTRRGSS